KSRMHELIQQVKRLAERNRDGGNTSQHDRKAILMLCAHQLLEAGFVDLQVHKVTVKHAQALAARWRQEGLGRGTLNNRMAALRWWAEKVGQIGSFPKTNAAFGFPSRQRQTLVSKAEDLPLDLRSIPDPYIQASLGLARWWGLRRKEALMIQPHRADEGGRLALQGSWCKSGRPRTIELLTEAQQEALEEAKRVTRPGQSLVPVGKLFIQQRDRFDYYRQKLGLHGAHTLRHLFAQEMYQHLTQFAPPLQGGPRWVEMTAEQQRQDEEARLRLSRMLGHNRREITAVYIGANR